MRVVLSMMALCAVAGCAHQQQAMQSRPVTEATNYDLCQAVILGNPGPGGQWVVENERIKRSLDCAPYSQAIVQQDAARRQQAMQALQIMQASQPVYQPVPVPQLPQQVNCTSQRFGNQVQTTCR